MTAQVFVDDDQGYLRWLTANPTGYVLNTTRNPIASYLILHRASCSTITGIPSRGRQWTGPYIKVCSTRRTDLDNWAEQATGGTVQACRRCAP
jgi:hypothetical protein